MIDVGPIGQKHIGNGSIVFVEAVRLKGDFLSKNQLRGGLLGLLAEGLAFL
jgi:hypothetical protein